MIIMANKSVAGFRDFSVFVSGTGVWWGDTGACSAGGLIGFFSTL